MFAKASCLYVALFKVCVRVRPINQREIAQGGKSLLRMVGGKVIVVMHPQVARDDFLR